MGANLSPTSAKPVLCDIPEAISTPLLWQVPPALSSRPSALPRSCRGQLGSSGGALKCRARGSVFAAAAAVATSAVWAARRRGRGQRHSNLTVLHANEYMEEFDALGKDLTGKAVLVGWDPGPKRKAEASRQSSGPSFSPKESLEELETLVGTLGIEVKDRVLQQWRPGTGRLPLRRGRAEELRDQIRADPELGTVVFDQDLPFRALMAMKGILSPNDECVILDRTSLILRIFAERARTAEAQLQVKLASQRYMLPRLRYYLTTGAGMEAQGGSSGAGSGGGALKGKGETQINMDRKLFLKKIDNVKGKLEDVRKTRSELRARHSEIGIPIVSLVGYTNAGKSTLMNQLCQATEVNARDRLFETLDTTRRRVTLDGGRDIMLADTVGFIQRLPEQLVMGFRATLEEVVDTTMILHVVDISSETAAQQVATVLRTLKRLPGFNPKTPQLMVYNKIDKLEGGLSEELEQSLKYPEPGIVGHCQISALNGIGLTALADAVEDTLIKYTDYGAAKMHLHIPYAEASTYAKLRRGDGQVKINNEEHTNDGYLLQVTASKDAERQLKKYQVTEEESKTLSLC